ncbi:MAG: hypothetical protein RLY78_4359 [Pseudomonadota bacterium]
MTLRFPVVDALKAVAAQLIVWHHLVAYGPVSQGLDQAWPVVSGWLYQDGRIAVQVFLVVGGFLAAQGLAGVARDPWAAIGRRYVRLVRPFMLAVVLTVAVSGLVRPWFDDPMLSEPVEGLNLLAHALLLHGILGHESLGAGVWYVAIDFQLFALWALLAWAGRRWPAARVWAVTGGVAVSLFVINLDSSWDVWAPYFFGAYGLGVLAALLRERRWLATTLIVVLGGVACGIEWRSRIAVATAVALLLLWAGAWPRLLGRRLDGLSRRLADGSYTLFLTHFAVLVLGNALYAAAGLDGALAASLAAIGLWAASQGLARAFDALSTRTIRLPGSGLALCSFKRMTKGKT